MRVAVTKCDHCGTDDPEMHIEVVTVRFAKQGGNHTIDLCGNCSDDLRAFIHKYRHEQLSDDE